MALRLPSLSAIVASSSIPTGAPSLRFMLSLSPPHSYYLLVTFLAHPLSSTVTSKALFCRQFRLSVRQVPWQTC